VSFEQTRKGGKLGGRGPGKRAAGGQNKNAVSRKVVFHIEGGNRQQVNRGHPLQLRKDKSEGGGQEEKHGTEERLYRDSEEHGHQIQCHPKVIIPP